MIKKLKSTKESTTIMKEDVGYKKVNFNLQKNIQQQWKTIISIMYAITRNVISR